MGYIRRAITELDTILATFEHQLSEPQRLAIKGELQRLRREVPRSERSPGDLSAFTQLYSCQNCGRLINYVSIRCPHCSWRPNSLEEMGRSLVLSNDHMTIPALLILAREISSGRDPRNVVRNLDTLAAKELKEQQRGDAVRRIYGFLEDNDPKSARSMSTAHCCPACQARVLWSGSTECDECGEVLGWPDLVRTLVCMDNLLWLMENRVEPSDSEDFSELICLLVVMVTNLLRKQEEPTGAQRQYALDLLKRIGCLADKNRGGIIDMSDLNNMTIYIVESEMLEDTRTFTSFLFKELEVFVTKMREGVRL
jgi:hypothetical protein